MFREYKLPERVRKNKKKRKRNKKKGNQRGNIIPKKQEI